MLQHSKSCLVPVLVDQFNDIIEWKATTLQKEVESFEAQKTATTKVLPIFKKERRFSVTDVENFRNTDISNVNESAFPKLKRSKSQKCFTKKINRVRNKAIKNTITENSETELNNQESVSERIARIKKEYQITTLKTKPEPVRGVKFAEESIKNELQLVSNVSLMPTESQTINHQQIIDDLAELKLNSFKLLTSTDQLLCDSEKLNTSPNHESQINEFDKIELKKLETFKVTPTYNVLLEKLQNVYR